MITFDRYAWLLERKTGIGSSDCAPILGMSPFKTALKVQQEKIGSNEPDEKESALLRLGLLMEPVILRLYEEKTGKKPRVPRKEKIMRHPEHDWMICSLDAMAGSPRHPLEVKNVIFPRGKWGTADDDIPEEYVLQGQHQLAVTGAKYLEYPVLIYGNFRIYRVQRNDRLIKLIIEKEKYFWEHHVTAGEPVPPDFTHPTTLHVLQQMYGETDGFASLGMEEANIAEEYKRLSEQISSLDEMKTEMKARLLSAMGNAAVAELPNGMRLIRQQIKRKAYEVAESTYVKLSVK